ncbi:hypothetical protein [Methanoregula formicica]|uniref:Uncharacterized protein n=1 Tax=Methanoregula formicica (strain DSM 22288 / NBRC 105244 / SMSP) TaxID=593750 RepID=L0HCE2_METFS|nr:hypothetical protein [Methanoregula formicica]AGB01481.1 hypothetical protein Metfor_0408 [Methanoregula formicica SMSP]
MTGLASGRPLYSRCPQGDRLQEVYNSGELLPFNHQLFVITVTRNQAELSALRC